MSGRLGIYSQAAAGELPLLLDLYPSAAAAYSLRLLKAGYTGAIVEIRRDSDNALKDFYPDASNELSLTSEDGAGTSLATWIGANNGFVRTWYEQSGNANDALNTNTANQPQVISSGSIIAINGKPSVRFLSSSQYLNSASASEFNSVTEASLFSVTAFDTVNAGNQYSCGVRITTNRGFLIGTETTGSSARFHYNPSSFGVANGGTLVASTQALITGLSSATGGSVSIDGSTVGLSATTYTAGTTNNYFLGQMSSLNAGGARNMQEFIAYPSDEGSNKAGIETNINDYFSIYNDPDAQAYITAGSITDATEIAAINQMFLDLKGTGSTTNNTDVWNSLHWMNIASATSLAASLNDLKGGYNLTAFNSPIWANTGIKGNASNMYLQQSYIASTDGSSLNSNSYGIAVRTAQTGSSSLMGSRNGSAPYNALHHTSGTRYTGNNSGFTGISSANWPTGVIINNRTSSASYKVWIDNLEIHNITATTNALSPYPMNVLSQNNASTAAAFSNVELTVAFEAAGLTDNQIEDLTDAIDTLNANIISGGR